MYTTRQFLCKGILGYRQKKYRTKSGKNDNALLFLPEKQHAHKKANLAASAGDPPFPPK
jgi:hypothetical protein